MDMTKLTEEHKRGIHLAATALSLMASDNSMSRTSKLPDIDATMAKQVIRVAQRYDTALEDFVQGDCCSVTRLSITCSAVDFHEWLCRVFDGDLSHEYFEGEQFEA